MTKADIVKYIDAYFEHLENYVNIVTYIFEDNEKALASILDKMRSVLGLNTEISHINRDLWIHLSSPDIESIVSYIKFLYAGFNN